MEKNQVDAWRRDLNRIDTALSDPVVASALEESKLSFEVKRRLLEERLPGLNPMGVNLVLFLAVKSRLHLFKSIALDFEGMVDALYGIEHAQVTTPFPVDESERGVLAARLAGILGKKKVVLEVKVDPAILGGMVARIGDKVIDGSSRTKLQNLKRNLQSGVSV